ncbi:MAG: HAMP domain-containing histidine kinase [Parabacteroides sp.]|nr:HAMP domain-containing histidine kinase [Parabacteroides sp.]
MKRYVLFLKIGLLVLLSLSIAFLLLKGLYFTAVMCFLVLLGIAYSLYLDQRKMLQRMEHLIANIHYGDMNLSFPVPSSGGAEANLTRAMNEALSAFRTRLYNVVVSEAETDAWQKLIRVLTHEIMNSIAPIISLSETVTERATSNGLNERDYGIMLQAMQTIHRRSKGLLDFVENYRKLTRIPAPTQQLFPVSVLFDDLHGLYPAGDVSFSFSVRPADLRLYVDRSMIEQVLINLLKNAAEACKDCSFPEVRVNASRREGVPVITVSDNGCGIVPEAMDKVFVPFFTTKQGGSGIGLSVCRQIMNRHGGSISVVSEEEKGTTFTLQFPQTRVL